MDQYIDFSKKGSKVQEKFKTERKKKEEKRGFKKNRKEKGGKMGKKAEKIYFFPKYFKI